MTAIRALSRETPGAALAIGAGIAALTLLASMKLGEAGMLAPLVAVVAVVLLTRPGLALGVFVTLIVVCENRAPGLLPWLAHFYDRLPGGISLEELLFVLVVLAVALDLLHKQRPPRLPRLLVFPLAMVVLAAALGAATGYFRGAGPIDVVFGLRQLPYLVVLPVMVVTLVETRRDIHVVLAVAAALAILKAVLGLLAVGAGRGISVEGATITYYEPTANWLAMMLMLVTLAALLLHARVPTWVLVGSLLALASLALSFRRSFWVGAALGLMLVVVLGVSPAGRRLLVPTAALVALAVWAVASVGFQSQAPLVERAASLKPSKVQANAEDRYRFDERANVLAEIRRRPITGLGVAVPWSSAARALPVEHENGREYVHTAVLYWWLKLGLIGLIAFVAVMAAAGKLSWDVWRRHRDPLMRAVGLASLCGLVGLAVIETTGSFTGVDLRFTVMLGLMLGVLAVLRHDTLAESS
jgi:O-antigen ligase